MSDYEQGKDIGLLQARITSLENQIHNLVELISKKSEDEE